MSRCSTGREIQALWQCGSALPWGDANLGEEGELSKGLLTYWFPWDSDAVQFSHTWGSVIWCRHCRVKAVGPLADLALDTVRSLSGNSPAAHSVCVAHPLLLLSAPDRTAQVPGLREALSEGFLSLQRSPKLQIRLKHDLSGLLGIESCVGWVWRCKVGFGGCCATWLRGYFTAPWCQAHLDWYCLERRGETEAGTLTAWQYFSIWLQSPTLPTQWLEAAGQIHGLRDLFIAHLHLGLGDRWGAWGKRDLLRLIDCLLHTGRQWPCYFKILFPHAVQTPAVCRLFWAAALLLPSTGIYLCWAQQGQATSDAHCHITEGLAGVQPGRRRYLSLPPPALQMEVQEWVLMLGSDGCEKE